MFLIWEKIKIFPFSWCFSSLHTFPHLLVIFHHSAPFIFMLAMPLYWWLSECNKGIITFVVSLDDAIQYLTLPIMTGFYTSIGHVESIDLLNVILKHSLQLMLFSYAPLKPVFVQCIRLLSARQDVWFWYVCVVCGTWEMV